jgi:hypothetical protein
MDTPSAQTPSAQTPSAHSPAPHNPAAYPGSHPIYKPNSRGTGGVVRFSLNPSKAAMFVDAASQCGERQFAWDQKFTMKWDLSDIGAALSVLQRRQPLAKLFHQSEKASSICELIARDDPNHAPYLLTLSRQDLATKDLHKVAIPLTHPEAAVLECVLQSAVPRILGW